MKRSFSCLILALVLALSMCVCVSASASEVPNDEDGPSESLQLMLAKLQLQQSQIAMEQAQAKMEEIAALQQEQQLVNGYLNAARQAKSQAESTNTKVEIPADMAQYMIGHGLSYGGGTHLSAGEWSNVISALSARLEALGVQTQLQMVSVQDFMGQYNSYMQGAYTQIANSNQTLTSIAKGQSMYGDSEAGLAVTALAVGLVLGCLATLSVQKLRRKTEKV